MTLSPAGDIKKMIAPLIIPQPHSLSPSSYGAQNATITPPLTPSSPSYSAFHPANASPPRPEPSLLSLPYSSLLGTGAWSKVYSLGEVSIAVKTPVNISARAVLESEAKILSYVASALTHNSGIAAFHGYDPVTAAVYMELIPGGTLETHLESCTPAHIRAPAIGMPQWLFLAEQLARTFSALKRTNVVHGDIKLGNILLRPWSPPPSAAVDPIWAAYIRGGGTLLEPVVVDFSSAHINLPCELPEAMSAVTTAYAAPELLQSFLSEPRHPLPTHASDLYSLALSLLAAAVGSEVYRNAGKHVGIYVRQGNPMGWVKADERGMKVGRGGAVSEVLEGCFGKTAEGRTGVEELGVRVEGWKKAWWNEGRTSGNPRWGC
ncbi:hypothetical protein Q9L58_006423 [Maublancomyces gigas]|uniref:Protein kinase domain-containing protein n=1 Tax=Discina gigas TaxID=1032678 RepID=A0ABR3GFS5_9PEZI